MLNTEINEFAAQSNLTQVASYFDIIDNSVKTGDTNKKYVISTNACNAPSAPIYNGGWTSVIISPTCDNMVDLYNSFITAHYIAEVELQETISAENVSQNNSKPPTIWVGFKDSMEAISQYQILANGQSIYTQSNAIEEAYITSLATPESVKQTDTYSKTRHEDVWYGKDTFKLGNFLKLETNKKKYQIDIEMKIDLRRFLPLASIRMMPAFIGNLELRLKFGTEGLVCSPVSLEYIADNHVNLSKCNSYPAVGCKFFPIDASFTYINKFQWNAEKTSITVATGNNKIVKVNNLMIDSCASHLACFGLDDNLYQGLVQRYTNESLSFPIQTLSFQGMNATISDKGMDLVLASTPRFVDSIFILLQQSQNHRTCYDNPLFETFSLKMGGYGVIPDIPYDSFSPEYYELASNAFNVNNDSNGFNVDVMKSLTNSRNISSLTRSNDVSNFVLAFPVSTDFTYQQGQTSSTPITYHLTATFDNNPNAQTSPYKNNKSTIALMGFLKDSVLAIQLRPQGPPIVAIDEYDITSPAD